MHAVRQQWVCTCQGTCHSRTECSTSAVRSRRPRPRATPRWVVRHHHPPVKPRAGRRRPCDRGERALHSEAAVRCASPSERWVHSACGQTPLHFHGILCFFPHPVPSSAGGRPCLPVVRQLLHAGRQHQLLTSPSCSPLPKPCFPFTVPSSAAGRPCPPVVRQLLHAGRQLRHHLPKLGPQREDHVVQEVELLRASM